MIWRRMPTPAACCSFPGLLPRASAGDISSSMPILNFILKFDQAKFCRSIYQSLSNVFIIGASEAFDDADADAPSPRGITMIVDRLLLPPLLSPRLSTPSLLGPDSFNPLPFFAFPSVWFLQDSTLLKHGFFLTNYTSRPKILSGSKLNRKFLSIRVLDASLKFSLKLGAKQYFFLFK